MASDSRVQRVALRSVRALFHRMSEWFPANGVVKYLSRVEKDVVLSRDQTPRLRKLGSPRLSYLDVGARYGLPKHVAHYAQFFDCVLVEPERAEAQRLRKLGYNIIDKALGASPGTMDLQVTAQTGASSVLRANQAVTRFLSERSTGDPSRKTNFEERHTVVDVQKVEVTTIELLSRDRGGAFDLVKIDTQGAEYEIVQGFGAYSPLFLNVEASMVEYYVGQKTFYELGRLLYERGYMMSSFDVPLRRPPAYSRSEPTWPGLPLHGDVSFMPDWSRPRGRELVAGRELSLAALMILFGMTDILSYLLDNLPFPEEARIREALATPAPDHFDAHGFSDRVPMTKTVNV